MGLTFLSATSAAHQQTLHSDAGCEHSSQHPHNQEQSSANFNICKAFSPKTNEQQKIRSKMANAGEYQQYHDVEPIFDGSYAILPFFKDNVCPRTFVSFFAGDCGDDNSQLVG